MKKQNFYISILVFLSIVFSAIVHAQGSERNVYEVEPTVLTPGDFTGEYIIMTSDTNYVLGIGKPTMTSSIPMAKVTVSKSIDNPNYYNLRWGNKIMSYDHKWDLEFIENATTSINWEIVLQEGTDNVVMFKRAGDEKAIKYEGGVLYSDSNPESDKDMVFSLMAVKSMVRPVVTPDSSLISFSDATLDPQDLSGNYVIETSTGAFMALHQSSKSTAQYAFKFTKEDEFYAITCGDWNMSYFHSWNLTFMPLADKNYLWNIVIAGEGTDQMVSFQRANNLEKYIKYEGVNFYSDGNSGHDILFKLHKANVGTMLKKVSKNNLKMYYAQNGSLILASDVELKNVRIFSLSGALILNQNVDGKNQVVNASILKSGVYIVQVRDINNKSIGQSIVVR